MHHLLHLANPQHCPRADRRVDEIIHHQPIITKVHIRFAQHPDRLERPHPHQRLTHHATEIHGQGMIRAHFMPGANTAIPWHNGDRAQVQRVTDFLQADRVRISIEQPTRTDTVESNLPISPEAGIKAEAPAYFYPGEDVKLTMIVTNTGVGHDFPGGTTDINEAWVHVRVVDAQNQLVYESGGLTEDNDVDPNAHFYRTLAVNRQGKHVWRHDLFNMVGDSYQKVVPAGASDVVDYSFMIPAWAKSPLTVSATVRYRKFNNRFARWALKRPEAKLPIVDVARTDIQLPVRRKPRVGSSGNNQSLSFERPVQ